MLIRKNTFTLIVATIFILSSALTAESGFAKDTNWIEGGRIWTESAWGTAVQRKWFYRVHPEKTHHVEIKSKGSLDLYWGNSFQRELVGEACNKINPKLYSRHEVKRLVEADIRYIHAKCETKEEYRLRQEQVANLEKEKRRHAEIAEKKAREVAEKLKEEQREKERQLAARSLLAKKDECTSFGFEPKTNAHSECVM